MFLLPSRRECVADARQRLESSLRHRRVCADACDTAVLVISELFTNAVLHTDSALITCEVRVTAAHVRLDVHDQGVRGPRERTAESTGAGLSPRRPDSRAENGRGLLLVESLADAWGVVPRAGGTGRTVWATLPLPPEQAPATHT
ncbi:hypothetical protein GCM10009654_27800 [Streptomyces hebeiensis]|uniref:Histidine kinase/HSP90-like ATPase domain-containing protein n=1 Tax=Streptomyces hebeiensis TaxID=229486 RepID=A0ABN1UTV7_9ACTN